MFKLASIIDDNFDVDSIFEDLKVFTDAIQRSGTVHFISSFFAFKGMGEQATKEVYDWLKTHPKFIMDSSLASWLVDDIQTNEFEQKRSHVASAIECYLKDYGVSRPEAFKEIQEMVASAWKDMNKFCLKPTAFPLSLLMRVINFARVMEDLYLYGDGYSDSSRETKEKINAVLIDPIPM
ncbi:hypothetical protein MRB53_010667 [Persea americana]|uniref:Uncharacterized protein n=1 Tax=Persea americana TaxID=3435 RepID=A0ACC2LSN5_PERAE|nr:hypothetical protein MRB53_010667 [Persea americana]